MSVADCLELLLQLGSFIIMLIELVHGRSSTSNKKDRH
ncbi:putative holin-like toxin [Lacticaseibacillus yichunensis]|uniref:Holin-like toxin n=1 Tax=Lacticaseibacillus yichunensis TaxID=2486015 RepID=A0ABW4CV81_9LACO